MSFRTVMLNLFQHLFNRSRNKFGMTVFVFCLCIAGGVFFLPAVRVLSISGRKAPDKVFYSAAAFKEGFIISYTHSVNKGRVHDYYRFLTNGTLELYKTQFVSYGAGIPEPGETPGAVFTVTDDGYYIENLDRKVPRLTMAVGIIANHSIAIGSEMNSESERFLTDFFEPQTSIILEYKRVSLFSYLRHKI